MSRKPHTFAPVPRRTSASVSQAPTRANMVAPVPVRRAAQSQAPASASRVLIPRQAPAQEVAPVSRKQRKAERANRPSRVKYATIDKLTLDDLALRAQYCRAALADIQAEEGHAIEAEIFQRMLDKFTSMARKRFEASI